MPAYQSTPYMPEMGFVPLGRYLDANRGVLDAGYANAEEEAKKLAGGVSSGIQQQAQGARIASAVGGSPIQGDSPSLTGQATQAQELSRGYGSEGGLAGKFGGGPGGAFNAALAYGSHGDGYQDLSKYLDQYSPQNVDTSVAAAAAEGAQGGIYTPPGGGRMEGPARQTYPKPSPPPSSLGPGDKPVGYNPYPPKTAPPSGRPPNHRG